MELFRYISRDYPDQAYDQNTVRKDSGSGAEKPDSRRPPAFIYMNGQIFPVFPMDKDPG